MSSTPKTTVTTRRDFLASAPVAAATLTPAAAPALGGLAPGLVGDAIPVKPDPDAALLALVNEYLAAYAEHDRLNDVIEETKEQKRWDKLTQAERDAAQRAWDVANERISRELLPSIEETPARTLAGAIAKARVVVTELPDDSTHSLSLSYLSRR